jgi:hypothetical protein
MALKAAGAVALGTGCGEVRDEPDLAPVSGQPAPLHRPALRHGGVGRFERRNLQGRSATGVEPVCRPWTRRFHPSWRHRIQHRVVREDSFA